jgi:hypothetical protein
MPSISPLGTIVSYIAKIKYTAECAIYGQDALKDELSAILPKYNAKYENNTNTCLSSITLKKLLSATTR